ncbi:GFA family protein [Microbulbifer hainanensis]|uniref:GFA family protein n=1 Tax=Microbulbifer hainanensis TaxID=2735675 RepID=UPI0038572CCF
MMKSIHGKCLCEGVKYRISGGLGPVYNCHCSKCRRWHGAPFRTRASIDVSQFELLTGRELLSSFKSSDNVTKYFCRVCGSPLHSTYEDKPNVLGVALGALEGVDSKPEANIFTASKASWYEINDGLPQYESWPGSEERVRETEA